MEERRNSEARIRTNNKWTNAHYDRINIAVPKGRKEAIQTAAAAAGQSVNAYINQAIDARMEAPVEAQRDGVVSVPMESAGSDTEGVQKEREGVHE